MRLHLRSRSARLVARPTTINIAFDVISGANRVDIDNNTTAFVPISTWSWSLTKGGVEVATSADEHPSFTSLVPGGDYRVTLIATSSLGYVSDPVTRGDFTVDPETLSTPSAPVAGSVSGFTIPLTFAAPESETNILERRLYYKISAEPTSSDSFLTFLPTATSHDFVADAAGTWHFKLQDIALSPFAQDSELSADASAVISSGGTAPSAPNLTAVTASGSHLLVPTWTIGANIGDGNHQVYRVPGADTGFTPDTSNRVASELSAAATSYNDVSVAPDTQYTYKVEAINGAGQAFSSGVSQTTPAQGAWPDNEPAQMNTIILNVDGSTKNIPGVTANTGWLTGTLANGSLRVEVVADSSAKNGATCIRKRWQIGDSSGWKAFFTKPNFSTAGFSELYYRLVCRPSDNFEWHPSGQKLFYHGYKHNSGTPKNCQLMVKSNGSLYHNVSYTVSGCSPGFRQWVSMNNSAVIGRGFWNTVEMHIVAQSAPGVADGAIYVWLNDSLVTQWSYNASASWDAIDGPWVNGVDQREDIVLVPACASTTKLTGLEAPLYWGGSNLDKSVDDHFDIAELYISGKP